MALFQVQAYFDNNATTQVSPGVLEAMLPFLTEAFGNPSSAHPAGRRAKTAITSARGLVARELGCSEEEVIFTSSATESNNLALLGSTLAPQQAVITTAAEHPSVLNCADALRRKGVRVAVIGVDSNGQLDLDSFAAALETEVGLVSIIAANNETGVINPIEQIVAQAKAKGCLVHVDAVQALCKAPLDFWKMGVDLLSVSAHKIHGPKGIGALAVRRGLRLKPLLHGGSQESGFRPGTENVSAIVGFGQAVLEIGERRTKYQHQVRSLRDHFEQRLTQQIEDVRINGSAAPRLPNTSSITIPKVDAQQLLEYLSRKGICISRGAACSAGVDRPSHVLLAMGLSHEEVYSTIRVSLGTGNTEEEVDLLLQTLVDYIKYQRRFSFDISLARAG